MRYLLSLTLFFSLFLLVSATDPTDGLTIPTNPTESINSTDSTILTDPTRPIASTGPRKKGELFETD